ncbi:MAG: radical SAM family heme chaperone HemW [Candidatus Symbiothrix sp.]|jgi:oxygen-independent coproporphyrinogen-3 oxidase|nr:radical SAM family heme chaperone HemW [Candidatus Symbiothrix sp.]
MAGIYFHIPFCKTRCVYCDFFSSTHTKEKADYVEAMCRELQERKDYLQGQAIETVYFGGGTPSQLSAKDFEKLFSVISSVARNLTCPVGPTEQSRFLATLEMTEVTLEANPDDITPAYLDSIKHLPFNRISLGIQSFNNAELKFLNRRHDAQSAIRAVQLCLEYGFQNISIDLMYGLPNQTLEIWEENIRQAIALDIQHVSAYHLIYEEGTPLFELLQQGRIQPVDEDVSVEMFTLLIDRLAEAGFEHYEISNFARPGFHSRHNSSYWNGTHYLGIGASAHSYNGVSRQWNKQVHGARYAMQGFEMERIEEKTAYNDFILTRLRTMKGIDLDELQSLFGEEKKNDCWKQAQKFLDNQLLEITGNRLRLTRKGIFVSDGIMSDLME